LIEEEEIKYQEKKNITENKKSEEINKKGK
jgi:hypothetical protein